LELGKKEMKIISPVNHHQEVNKLVEAGAKELYCGFVPPQWVEKYGNLSHLNRRPNISLANLKSFSEMDRIVKQAHKWDAKVYVTLNSHCYLQEHYNLLKPLLKDLSSINIDAFDVADLGLLLTIKEMDLPQEIIISGEGMTQNVQTAMFYRDLGASGIIFPRQMEINEIRKIVRQVPEVDFKVFIINERCRFSGGLCTPTHGLLENFCETILNKMFHENNLKNSSFLPLKEEVNFRVNQIYYSLKDTGFKGQEWSGLTLKELFRGCGLCAIKEFMEIGVAGLKIVGRGAPTSNKIAWIKMIKWVMDLARTEKTFESFRKSIIELKSDPDRCEIGLNCYYPLLD
jgi:collagenase-like PrtC family protease